MLNSHVYRDVSKNRVLDKHKTYFENEIDQNDESLNLKGVTIGILKEF